MPELLAPAPAPTSNASARGQAPLTREQLERALTRLDRIAHLMDDQFELPLIKRRVGLDPIIGLIPGGGDWVVWFVSVFIFLQAFKLGVPNRLLLQMALHIAIDLLGGYVPGVGDLFDAAYKANKRNVQLVRAHFGAAPELGSALPITLPERALARPSSSPAARYALIAALIVGLLILASGPFALLYLLVQGVRG